MNISNNNNEYYLKNILYALNNFISWISLKYSKFLESDKKYHYKTIHKNIYYGAIKMFKNMLIMIY